MKQQKSTAKLRDTNKELVSPETNCYAHNRNLRNKKIGILGEDYACEYLEKIGLSIYERNYAIKYGEIDIVAVSYETTKDVYKENFIHRSVSANNFIKSNKNIEKVFIIEVKTCVSHETNSINAIENATFKKLIKVAKLGEFYVKDKFIKDIPYSLCVCAVYLNKDMSLKKIDFIKDIEI